MGIFQKTTEQRLDAIQARKTKAVQVFKAAHDDLTAANAEYDQEIAASRGSIEELKESISKEEKVIDYCLNESRKNNQLLEKLAGFLGEA